MKQIMKRVIGFVLAMALTAGGMVTHADTLQAKNKAFENKNCNPHTESYMDDGSFAIEPWFYYGSRNNSIIITEPDVKLGTVIKASVALSPHASIKSVSITSSNKKILKVDKKKGTFTAKKLGTATISYKVVWTTSDKIYKTHNTKNVKTTKSGNTYTSSAKVKVNVICKSHKYGSWVTTKAVSCEKDGMKQKTCSKCKRTVKKMIEATDHKYDSTTHKCTKCGRADPDYEEEEEEEEEMY